MYLQDPTIYKKNQPMIVLHCTLLILSIVVVPHNLPENYMCKNFNFEQNQLQNEYSDNPKTSKVLKDDVLSFYSITFWYE